jgi:hypothetical protein
MPISVACADIGSVFHFFQTGQYINARSAKKQWIHMGTTSSPAHGMA